MAHLDSSIRRVALQFSFSHAPDIVPSRVRSLDPETLCGSAIRKSLPVRGCTLVEPTEACSLLELLGDLEEAGCELVDGLYQERVDYRNRSLKRRYHMMRFLFVPKEHARDSVELAAARAGIREELKEICRTSLWRVRAFLNPLVEDGKIVEGQYAVSINLEVRQPLFRPDGKPVSVWRRDESGNKIGGVPLPLRPKTCLRIVKNGDILAVPE